MDFLYSRGLLTIFSKNKKLYFKNQYAILIYSILIIISSLTALLSVKNIGISSDSIHYGLISQQISLGNGIRTPLIPFDSNIIPINCTIPQTWYPLLLPVLIALLGGATSHSLLAAQILNLICHVVTTIFTFLLMKKLYENQGIALLTGILVSISFPLLNVTHHFWTEPLFIALTLVAIYFLTVSRHFDHYQTSRNLFLASICASAGILTRWAGIPIIAVFYWKALILIKNKKPGFEYKTIILSIIIPVITLFLIFARNYILVGTILGFNSIPPERSYLESFIGTVMMIFSQFDLGKNSIILIMIFFVSSIIYIVKNDKLRREALKYFNADFDIIIIYIISYITFICVSRPPRLELRYMVPLVPFLFIISILAILFVCKMLELKGFSKLALSGMILSLSIITFGNCYKTLLNLPEFFDKQKSFYSIRQSCTYNWLIENYEKNIIIATNKPFHLSFFGGYSTVMLPHNRWQTNIPIPKDMKSVLPNRMSKFGAQVLALFEEVEEQHDGGYLAELFNKREDKDKFILVHECSDGVVYRLRE